MKIFFQEKPEETFDDVYKNIIYYLLECPENKIENRHGQTLHEIENAVIEISNIDHPYAFCRNLNFRYLIGELLFYLKGENKLENIVDYSKFWKKCSDDGISLNSCYGYYIWELPTAEESTNQFDYCINQLKNNQESKKAVITIYDSNKHSKKTSDNPCTMYLSFNIRNDKLNMTVHMRSNDIYFGLPYDLPFFIFVQKMMVYELNKYYPNLVPGKYTHISNSLHLYDKNFEAIKNILKKPYPKIEVPKIDFNFFKELDYFVRLESINFIEDNVHPFIKFAKKQLIKEDIKTITEGDFYMSVEYELDFYFKTAKKEAEKSLCLKKKVGCVIVKNNKVLSTGYGGRSNRQGKCEKCYRKEETFYQDDCNSIHSEQRAIMMALSLGYKEDLVGSTIYLTHGPCDQCMKFLIEAGIEKVFYEEPYKTDFTRYKGLIEIYHKMERVI